MREEKLAKLRENGTQNTDASNFRPQTLPTSLRV